MAQKKSSKKRSVNVGKKNDSSFERGMDVLSAWAVRT